MNHQSTMPNFSDIQNIQLKYSLEKKTRYYSHKQRQNLLWGRRSGVPQTPTPPLKFSVKTKIGLRNSSTHRNSSVIFSISLPLWYYMAHFFRFSFSLDLRKSAPTFFPPPNHNFDKITPLVWNYIMFQTRIQS